jgi:hypothetical protein
MFGLTPRQKAFIIPRHFPLPTIQMQRASTRSCPAYWLSMALAWGPLALVSLRAETPANPLRQLAVPESVIRLSAIAPAENKLAEPRSVVPGHFGEPELLPPVTAGEFAPAADPMSGGYDDVHYSQNLVHRWIAEPWFSHSDPNDPGRHIGLGQPLIGTSWRNRPLFTGAFVGGVLLDDLVSNRVDQNDTALVGLRLGHDFDHYWGLELRYAFARPELSSEDGDPLSDNGRDYFADLSLVRYPWGDAFWRPYFQAGLGFQTFRFLDAEDRRISESLLSIPLGVGIKYFSGPWFSLRFEFVDNIALGNERVSGMHNFSFCAGAEYRFGGRRTSYFPWHGNATYW